MTFSWNRQRRKAFANMKEEFILHTYHEIIIIIMIIIIMIIIIMIIIMIIIIIIIITDLFVFWFKTYVRLSCFVTFGSTSFPD